MDNINQPYLVKFSNEMDGNMKDFKMFEVFGQVGLILQIFYTLSQWRLS